MKPTPDRIKVIACAVLAREMHLCAARARLAVDLVLLRQGLHSNPDTLRARVQAEVDATEEGAYRAVALGYGLCSNGVAGVRAGGIPLVLARAHDCITLLLGSAERYAEHFQRCPGTYYYSSGWIERGDDAVPRRAEDGAGLDAPFEELVRKYGRDNAEYLREFQSAWIGRYTHAALIDAELGDTERYREHTRRIAAERGWSYLEIPADLSLLQDLMDGEWDADRFLVVPPGRQVVARVGPEIVGAAACAQCAAAEAPPQGEAETVS